MKLNYGKLSGVLLLIALSASASYAQEQFTHTVTGLNKNCNATCTVFDVPALNNNPTAIILVTPVVGNGMNLNPHPIGAYYMYLKKWSIINLDQTAIAEGAKFNVQYFLNPGPDRFVYIVPQRVRESDVPYIDHAGLNDNPNAQIRFFPTGSPTRGALYNKDEIKVEYDATVRKWCIANVNNKPVTSEAAYNIVIDSRGSITTNLQIPKNPGKGETTSQTTNRTGDGTAPINAETNDSSAVMSDIAALFDRIGQNIELAFSKLGKEDKNDIEVLNDKIYELNKVIETLKGQMEKLEAVQKTISELLPIMQQLEREEQKWIQDLKEQKIKAILQANELIKQKSSKVETKVVPDTTAIEWFRLIREYEDNVVAADAKYTGRRIRVTGAFEHAEIEKSQIIVWFTTPAATVSRSSCYFQNSQRAVVAALKRGETIVVEGTCRGLIHPGQVTLENCVLR